MKNTSHESVTARQMNTCGKSSYTAMLLRESSDQQDSGAWTKYSLGAPPTTEGLSGSLFKVVQPCFYAVVIFLRFKSPLFLSLCVDFGQQTRTAGVGGRERLLFMGRGAGLSWSRGWQCSLVAPCLSSIPGSQRFQCSTIKL